jgi:hypothetical protein
MRHLCYLRTLALSLLCVSIAMPRNSLAASPPHAAQSTVTDIVLQEGGLLRGQLLDGEGNAEAGADVTVQWQNRRIVTTTTNERGEFSVAGLRGGLHTIATERGVAGCRFWAPSTAPPNVPSELLLVANESVLRGNNCRRHAIAQLLSNPWAMGLIAATAIIIPVAINAGGDSGS